MSMRENPIRRRPSARPPWLLPALVVGGVAVAAALVVIIVRLVGSSDDAADAAAAAPEPSCSTVMAAPADELPLPQKVRVNVYNATETSGLASKTARELTRRGFEVKEVANDPVGLPVEGVARIRYGPSSTQRAELLAYYVPGAELVEVQRKGPKIDLAIGDQFIDIAPQTDVDAALNTPEAVLTGPGCFGQTAATTDAGTMSAEPIDPTAADTTGVTSE